ncbi:hypothetical protein OnM2_096018 [Erysiphe neolycopersici]|uniref:Uncharacterized protein n=1 Tax=Erysiphe neolycopersici TaxID=212602 RepID=A0A420HAR4_9PEZI|nr:hypothetical protein OnM2_096018 [Erysiphe neolycopersici]
MQQEIYLHPLLKEEVLVQNLRKDICSKILPWIEDEHSDFLTDDEVNTIIANELLVSSLL